MRITRQARLLLLLIACLAFACSGDTKDDEPTPTVATSPIPTAAAPTTEPTDTPSPAVVPTVTPTPGATPPEETPTPATVEWKDLFDQDTGAFSPVPPGVTVAGFPQVDLEPAFDGLTFERMTGLYEDATGAWYVTEQPGRIERIDPSTGEATLWLDLTDRVLDDHNEKGLGGFALAPDFGASGLFYVTYTNEFASTLARFHALDSVADPASEQVLLTVYQPGEIHNFGQIAFGPDGYLYVASGDGGVEGDFLNLAQNLTALYGKILRLDVSDPDGDYRVPADNPFSGVPDAQPETWAYGFRNPWRFSFDHATGDLWTGDVGEYTREEIDLVQPGGNFGWHITEGSGCRNGAPACRTAGFVPPVYDYPHSEHACAIIGGFVYRGSAIPDLQGAYVFTDLCSGVLDALRVEDDTLEGPVEIANTGVLSGSLAQDNDGELYVLELATKGRIFRVVP